MSRKKVDFDSDLIIRGSTYWYRATPLGQKGQIELSLKIKVGALKREVLAAKKELLDSLGLVGNTKGSTAFPVLSAKYIAFRKKEGLADKTLFEVENIMTRHLLPFFRRYRVEEINQPIFNDFCETKKDITVIPHRKVLNHFLKWCMQNGYVKYRMQVDVPKFAKKQKRQREILTPEEIRLLLTNLDAAALLYHSMYLLMGMRNSEIIKLKWEDVSFLKNSIRIDPANNKSRRGRVVPVNSTVKRLLEAFPKRSKWVFPARFKDTHMDETNPFRSQWERALASAKITRHLTRHDLRATFETFMHKNQAFTDTQREKMAGAAINVQRNVYVTMSADDLRGLEESVQVDGLDAAIKFKVGANTRAKRSKSDGAK